MVVIAIISAKIRFRLNTINDRREAIESHNLTRYRQQWGDLENCATE